MMRRLSCVYNAPKNLGFQTYDDPPSNRIIVSSHARQLTSTVSITRTPVARMMMVNAECGYVNTLSTAVVLKLWPLTMRHTCFGLNV